MKATAIVEFWFASALGIAAVVVGVVVAPFVAYVLHYGGHDAALLWLPLLLIALLFLVLASCIGWECLLLNERPRNPTASLTLPTLLFGLGLVAALLMLLVWSFYR